MSSVESDQLAEPLSDDALIGQDSAAKDELPDGLGLSRPENSEKKAKNRQEKALRESAQERFYSEITPKWLLELSQVKRVILHCTSIDPLGEFSAGPLEMLDDRVRMESLSGLVGALLENAKGAPLQALRNSLKTREGFPKHAVSDVEHPTPHSIYGAVAGAELLIGDQEFLLEKGVLIDSLADTLLDETEKGFYLLVAIGDSVIARSLITPPRQKDGKTFCELIGSHGIGVSLFSLGYSSEAEIHANEMGLTAASVEQVDSTVHLDSLIERQLPSLVITSDVDCAEYLRHKSLVVLASARSPQSDVDSVLVMNGFGFEPLTYLFDEAFKHAKLRKIRLYGLIIGLAVISAIIAISFL